MKEQEENDVRIKKRITGEYIDSSAPDSEKPETEALEDAWVLAGMSVKNSVNVESALEKLNKRIDQHEQIKAPSRKIYYWMSIAAGVLVLFISGVLLYQNHHQQATTTIVYNATEIKKSFTLPDSTLVDMNKQSEIIYKNTGSNQRLVELEGEAFFSVKHDPEHPFIVMTHDLKIEVIGTEFNVKAYPEKPSVITVKSGKVKTTVLKLGETVLLTPKEQFSESNLSSISNDNTTDKIETNNYLAWKTGLLEFKNAKLSSVATTLEELYNIKINYDQVLENCELSAQFDNRNLDFVLKVIETTLKIEITKKDNTYTLAGSGC